MNPHTYDQLIHDKVYTTEKRQSLQQQSWENWTAICQTMSLEHSFTPYTKINTKCFKDLNRRLQTIKFLEETNAEHFLT